MLSHQYPRQLSSLERDRITTQLTWNSDSAKALRISVHALLQHIVWQEMQQERTARIVAAAEVWADYMERLLEPHGSETCFLADEPKALLAAVRGTKAEESKLK